MIETCIHDQGNSAQCADLRKPKDQQVYELDNLANYICTNSTDEQTMYDYVNKLRNDLIRCENKGAN